MNSCFLNVPLCLLLITGGVRAAEAGEALGLWIRKVQPLLDVQCAKCHGPIEQKGGLELDTPEAIFQGGDEGPVVVPGKPEESALYRVLAEGADPHMPPKKQLSGSDREVIREWIAALAQQSSQPPVVAPEPPRSFPGVIEAVDALVAEGWAMPKVAPAAGVSDTVWQRRVTLDLAGRIPTEQERREFLEKTSEDRRAVWVDRLLGSEEYGVRMRELWDVFLMGRGKRENQEDRRRKNGWWTFLEHSFHTNRPWNEVVRDLLTARPADLPETKGASWFLYERRNEHQKMAEAVAPLIYGTRLDCAQCHDHPLAREIKQGHYWGLVAVFNRSKNVEGTTAVGESAVGGFMNYTNLHKESRPAEMVLLTGHKVPENWPAAGEKETDSDEKYVDPAAKVKVPRFSRRQAFAEAATRENPLLARSFVNRMWSALFGRGLVHPVEEMNARNVPSHPALLDWLAQDFAANQYNVRRLIRGMVLSRVYALDRAVAAVPPESFAGFLERPLTGEQLARSWRIVARQSPQDDALRKSTIQALPEVLPESYNPTFQQAQYLTNSPLLSDLLQPREGHPVARLSAIAEIPDRVREAFQIVHGRPPDEEEQKAASQFLSNRTSDAAAATRDLVWALLTSAEFLNTP